MKAKKDICQLCMDFYRKYEEDTKYPKNIVDAYPALMTEVLDECFGIKEKSVSEEIIASLGQGNWEHLWQTDEEAKQSPEKIAENLLGEIFYCSDRWTWDRVLRTNWLYLRLYTYLKNEEWEAAHNNV